MNTMTKEVAERLNSLRAASVPAVLRADIGTLDGAYSLVIRCIDIVASHYPAAIDQEIRLAAAERRSAIVSTESISRYSLTHGAICGMERQGDVQRPLPVCRLAIALALPELEAAVGADNAARLAAYEQYRVLCEQGVALPPSE